MSKIKTNERELASKISEWIIETDSEIKAEFAELLSLNEIFQILIPKDEKIAEKIIKSYKHYIRKLEQDLEKNAHEKLHDWALAEKMSKEILQEYGIPLVGDR